MIINNVPFTTDLASILDLLKIQLAQNRIDLLQRPYRDMPDNIMVCCPYHKEGQERRPSAGIKKDDGTFHCFTCGETHSLQEVISHCFGREDLIGSYGWNWLLKNFISIGVENRQDVNIDCTRNSSVGHNNLRIISDEELDSYRYIHPYMYKRKMTDDIIDLFDIGYDKSTECITFPVRNESGECLFVARRSVNTKYFNYPSGVEKPVYGLYECRIGRQVYPKTVYICESMIDAITCWVYNQPAVALNGLGTDAQILALSKMPCREFVLATDNDAAGKKARKYLYDKLHNVKIIKECIIPENKKDINDLSFNEFNLMQKKFYLPFD